jgi:hypothetical protein
VYTGDETDDYMSIITTATPLANDLVVGKCTFTGGGNLQGFDYTERSTPNTQDLFLKVEVTGDLDLRVRVRAGRIQNGNASIIIPDQKSGLFVPPAENSRIDLVYVNVATGAITIEQGVSGISPFVPSYAGKLVLAEVTLQSTSTSITSDMIQDARNFASRITEPDNVYLEYSSSGKLQLKDASITNAKITNNTIESSKLKTYDSGWFAVTTGVTYTKAHGLASLPFMVQLWFSNTVDGSGDIVLMAASTDYAPSVWADTNITVVGMDINNIKIRGGGAIANYIDANGVGKRVTSGYARIKAIL